MSPETWIPTDSHDLGMNIVSECIFVTCLESPICEKAQTAAEGGGFNKNWRVPKKPFFGCNILPQGLYFGFRVTSFGSSWHILGTLGDPLGTSRRPLGNLVETPWEFLGESWEIEKKHVFFDYFNLSPCQCHIKTENLQFRHWQSYKARFALVWLRSASFGSGNPPPIALESRWRSLAEANSLKL